MSKKRIWFLIWNLKQCGGNKVVVQQAEYLKKTGYDVKVYALVCGRVKPSLKGLVEPVYRVFGQCSPDYLVVTFWPTAYFAALIKARVKVYYVLGWEPSYYRTRIVAWLAELSYYLRFRYITISPFLVGKLQKYQAREKIVLVPLGIDLGLYRQASKKHKISKQARILTVVSSYQKYKGIDVLTKMVEFLKTQIRGVCFVLVSFETKPYSFAYNVFLSRITDRELVSEYHKADLALALGRTEGFFLPGLEAMACGCPSILAKAGGTETYARNNINCLVLEKASKQAVLGAIRRLLNDKRLRARLVRNGYQTASCFDLQKAEENFEIALIGKDKDD